MDSAIAAAHASPGVGGRSGSTFRVGAAIYKGSNLLIAKSNTYGQSTKLLKFTQYPNLHAETNAILHLGIDRACGTTLYIARVLRSGGTALAKPCEVCHRWIQLSGIKRVYYTTSEGVELL